MAYITRIRIDQCRNVRQLDIDLSVPSPENGASPAARPRFRHLILTGPNGSGKSGVLERIAQHAATLLYPTVGQAVAELDRSVEWEIPHDHLFNRGKLGEPLAAYLPARRRIHRQEVSGPSRLDWDPGKVRPATEASERLLQFLVNKRTEMALAAEDDDDLAVERARRWFATFEGHLRRLMEDPGLTLDFDRRALDFRFRRSDGYTFDVNELADGHAAVVAILAELLLRVEILRETRRDFTFEPEGVVVVDEIETHLHLSLQEQILPFLTELFPRFQFLVATHSPAVIASIPDAVVYDLKKREATLSDHFRGLRYGTLMTEHFGISSEVDLDSTEKLLRVRALAALAERTPEQEREMEALSVLLHCRSPAMAVELWMIQERLGGRRASASSDAR